MLLERDEQLASLIPALFGMRLVTVRPSFFFSVLYFANLITPWQNFEGKLWHWRSNCDLLTLDSRGICNVHMGLYHYLHNGGRSRLEIKVEFYEGLIPLSTLLALYWYCFPCSLSSVLVAFRFFHPHLSLRSNGGRFDRDHLSECILR